MNKCYNAILRSVLAFPHARAEANATSFPNGPNAQRAWVSVQQSPTQYKENSSTLASSDEWTLAVAQRIVVGLLSREPHTRLENSVSIRHYLISCCWTGVASSYASDRRRRDFMLVSRAHASRGSQDRFLGTIPANPQWARRSGRLYVLFAEEGWQTTVLQDGLR